MFVGLDPSSFCSLQPMVTLMMEQSPEELGDLYLDVAEAFMDKGEYVSALPLLAALVCSERYNLAVVWLRHAGFTFASSLLFDFVTICVWPYLARFPFLLDYCLLPCFFFNPYRFLKFILASFSVFLLFPLVFHFSFV